MKLFKKFFVIIIFLALYNDLSAQDHVWPMLRYDAQNSGQSPYNGPTEQPKNAVSFKGLGVLQADASG